MDKLYLEILGEFGITELDNLDGILLERDSFFNDEAYKRIKTKITELKTYFSSSLLTSLQENAENKQKFPLVNIVRQLLKAKYYTMEPIRKANGYEKGGKKLYKRFYLIKKIPS
ncbi:MAG: hypothetical protein ACR2M6_00420 [Vampirovibrionia bacterium]|jgi:hypothetical protein